MMRREQIIAASSVAACVAIAIGACSVRSARVTGEGIPCSRDSQCESGEVCFLGECRGSSTALSSVLAEVRPPPGTSYGTSQVAGIDLRSSVIANFTLLQSLNVSGQVVQLLGDVASDGGSPVSGASLTFAARNPVIPDRALQVSVQATSGGDFATKLPVATWDASIVPPPPLPPLYSSLGLGTSAPSLELLLPAASNLLRVQGLLTAGGQPLAGARVLAVDASGLLLAAAASADATGAFQLVLPPGATSFYLRAGPSSEVNAAVGTAGALLPNYAAVGPFSASSTLVTFDYPAPPAASALSGTVTDSSGNPVAGARVYALSTDGQGYVLSNSATTTATGSYSLPLLAGMFAIEAAPSSSQATLALSSEKDLRLAAPSASLDIVLPARVTAQGQIVEADGTTPAPVGTQISATRLPDRLVTSRVATAQPADAQGKFQIVADAGSYRVVIAPPPSTGLPSKTVVLEIDQSTAVLPTIQLSQPLEVVGTVSGSAIAGGTVPLAGATVEFFALDAAGVHSLSLGSGITDSSGHYKALLPDVEQPAAQSASGR